jgi:hypothetical protein
VEVDMDKAAFAETAHKLAWRKVLGEFQKDFFDMGRHTETAQKASQWIRVNRRCL